jgi:vancomycin resistance protein YoaR
MTTDSVTDTRVQLGAADMPPAPTDGRRRSRSTRVLQIVGITIGAVVAFVALEQLVFTGRVLPGVHVDGTDVALRTEGSARENVEDLAHRLQGQPIEATFDGHTFRTTPDAVGLRIDAAATARAAHDAGREGLNPLERLAAPFRRLTVGEDVALHVHYDAAKVRAVLAQWEQEGVTGYVPGDVTFQGTTVSVIPPKAGMTVDADAAVAPFDRALRSGTRDKVALPGKVVDPVLDLTDIQHVADNATAILSAPYEVSSGTKVVTVTPEEVASALSTTRDADGTHLTLAVDPARLAAAVGARANGFTVPAVDATFAVNGDNSVSVIPSQDGRSLDFTAVGAAILTQQRRIETPLAPLHPKHDTAWAQSLGIKEQVSTFTTQHPCCAPRVANIHRAADLIQNTVVEPGQVFSLNEAIGQRTAARGFVEAPVYYQGFTTDIGGGVSQLSTTVYNAAWWGGFEIVTHKPHSIWISRYPAGREATLNWGSVDNKFRNNSQHGILVHTSYNGTSITVSIYGDREGKVVREENRQVTSGHQAPSAAFTVEYDRVIDQPGHAEVREHYRWHYVAAPPE